MHRRFVEASRSRRGIRSPGGAVHSDVFRGGAEEGFAEILPRKTGSGGRKRGQQFCALIKSYKRIMSFLPSVRKWGLCCLFAVASPAFVFAQSAFVPWGTEYPIAGSLPGDQVHPALSFNAAGGF